MAHLDLKPKEDKNSVEIQAQSESSYISSLKHLSAMARSCAPQNRMIERLRKCTDLELSAFGIERSEIEQLVYSRKLA